MPRRTSGNRIVIEGIEQGSVFPGNREDCSRDLIIDGRKDPFMLDDGAFSLSVTVRGAGQIMGPVYSGDSMVLENDGKKGPQCILSGATARRTITTETPGKARLRDSVVATTNDPYFVFRGDVTAGERISLRNACVLGTVRAPEVELVNSVVLGMIDAVAGIHLTCSLFGMYRTVRLLLEGPVTAYCGGGVSREKPEFQPFSEGSGKEYRSAMRFFPLCRLEGWGCGMQVGDTPDKPILRGLGCTEWIDGTCTFLKNVELLPLDFVRMDARELNEGWATAWFLTLQGRAMNMGPVYEANDRFERILQGVSGYEHLTPENQERQRTSWLELTPHEARILQLATEGVKQ